MSDRCPKCHGQGWVPFAGALVDSKTCPECSGTGRRHNPPAPSDEVEEARRHRAKMMLDYGIDGAIYRADAECERVSDALGIADIDGRKFSISVQDWRVIRAAATLKPSPVSEAVEEATRTAISEGVRDELADRALQAAHDLEGMAESWRINDDKRLALRSAARAIRAYMANTDTHITAQDAIHEVRCRECYRGRSIVINELDAAKAEIERLTTVKREVELVGGIEKYPEGKIAALQNALEGSMSVIRTLRAQAERMEATLAAYVGAREFDDGCLCEKCVAAITRRLEAAEELVATLDAEEGR